MDELDQYNNSNIKEYLIKNLKKLDQTQFKKPNMNHVKRSKNFQIDYARYVKNGQQRKIVKRFCFIIR